MIAYPVSGYHMADAAGTIFFAPVLSAHTFATLGTCHDTREARAQRGERAEPARGARDGASALFDRLAMNPPHRKSSRRPSAPHAARLWGPLWDQRRRA
jgi:hypothetical protein